MLFPYHPSVKNVIKPEGFDDIYYPEGMEFVPHRAVVVEVNKRAISESGCVIAYLKHTVSNTIKFIEYAERKGVKIMYIN